MSRGQNALHAAYSGGAADRPASVQQPIGNREHETHGGALEEPAQRKQKPDHETLPPCDDEPQRSGWEKAVPCFGSQHILFGAPMGEPDKRPPQPGQRTRTPPQPAEHRMHTACQTAMLLVKVVSPGRKSLKNTFLTRRGELPGSAKSRPRRLGVAGPTGLNRSRGVERFAPGAWSRWSDSLHHDSRCEPGCPLRRGIGRGAQATRSRP